MNNTNITIQKPPEARATAVAATPMRDNLANHRSSAELQNTQTITSPAIKVSQEPNTVTATTNSQVNVEINQADTNSASDGLLRSARNSNSEPDGSLLRSQPRVQNLSLSTNDDLAKIQLEIKNYWQGKEPKLSKQAINELSIYKSLVISSIGDLLESVYPLSKQVIGSDWDNIVIQYLETYPSSSPVFNRAAEHFPKFLRANKHPDWLCELAQYEWAELAVEIEPVNSANNFRLLNFKYPISKILTNADKTIQPSPEQILVYCDPETHRCKKLKLTTISALALTAILEDFSDEEGLESLTEILGLTQNEEIEKLKQEYLSFKNFIISNNITKAINYKPVAAT